MNIIADTHCHTIASSHAYSTLLELVEYAKRKGLMAIAITDHAAAMPGAPHAWHFSNLRNVPDVIDGIIVLKGAEVNIIDYDGNIDLEPNILRHLNWVIASYHEPCCPGGTIEQNTNGWVNIAKNPKVNVIGHAGTQAFDFDYDIAIPEFKKNGKVLEINSHSFTARKGAAENCEKIALACKKYELPIVVSSDAHIALEIGDFANAIEMLQRIDFPEELILNADRDRFLEYIQKVTGKTYNI